MKILLYSDLHLESDTFTPPAEAVAAADVVVLAGDIQESTRALPWIREHFQDRPVLYVPGNHEFYVGHLMRTLDELREACGNEIELLECDVTEIGGYRFLGTTLWTDYDLFGPDQRERCMGFAKSNLLDFAEIKVSRTPEFHYLNGNRLTPEALRRRHLASMEWLEAQLELGDPARTLVITHHAPSIKSVPDIYKESPLSASYASDLTQLGGRAALWLHGHMHTSSDYQMNGTRVVSNPRGQPDWMGGIENHGFNPSLLIEV